MNHTISVAAKNRFDALTGPGERLVFTFTRTGGSDASLPFYYRVRGTARPIQDFSVGDEGSNPFGKTDGWLFDEVRRGTFRAGATEMEVWVEADAMQAWSEDRSVEMSVVVPVGLPEALSYGAGQPAAAAGWLAGTARSGHEAVVASVSDRNDFEARGGGPECSPGGDGWDRSGSAPPCRGAATNACPERTVRDSGPAVEACGRREWVLEVVPDRWFETAEFVEVTLVPSPSRNSSQTRNR